MKTIRAARIVSETVALLLLGMAGPGVTSGQILHASDPLPSFEVASVRPSSPGEMRTRLVQSDRFLAKALSMKDLISYAYGINYDAQLSGGPGWVKLDQFTIDAKPDETEAATLTKASRDDRDEQIRLMVQGLLADRFHLKVHIETRDLPVYALVVAKGGLKCAKDSSPSVLSDGVRPRYGWASAPPPPPPPPGYVPPTPEEVKSLAQQPLHLRTKGWPFWLLVTMLSHQPELGGRMVVDRTGLDGSYDCEASWSRENSEGNGASLFTAIQEQMGLKLEPEKGPVEVLVIDHIEKPSEN
ncbi:MAG TPA: TIGR03435 family protein [Acidobacteriaceae bacterium]